MNRVLTLPNGSIAQIIEQTLDKPELIISCTPCPPPPPPPRKKESAAVVMSGIGSLMREETGLYSNNCPKQKMSLSTNTSVTAENK
jgi:hypothetical protein